MSKYECSNCMWISGSYTIEKELDPSDYLNCEDEDEVREQIGSDLELNVSELEIYDSENDVFIPDEFINEWKKLKSEIDLNQELNLDFNCNITGVTTSCVKVCPSDFLDCKNEKELQEQVFNYISNRFNVGDCKNVHIEQKDFTLSNTFIECWKKLKDKYINESNL